MFNTLPAFVHSDPPCDLEPMTSEASLELFGQGPMLGFAPGELLAVLWTRIGQRRCP